MLCDVKNSTLTKNRVLVLKTWRAATPSRVSSNLTRLRRLRYTYCGKCFRAPDDRLSDGRVDDTLTCSL